MTYVFRTFKQNFGQWPKKPRYDYIHRTFVRCLMTRRLAHTMNTYAIIQVPENLPGYIIARPQSGRNIMGKSFSHAGLAGTTLWDQYSKNRPFVHKFVRTMRRSYIKRFHIKISSLISVDFFDQTVCRQMTEMFSEKKQSYTKSFFKENVRCPVWTCRDPISPILGTRFSLILGTRFSILGTPIVSLKHLNKPCMFSLLEEARYQMRFSADAHLVKMRSDIFKSTLNRIMWLSGCSMPPSTVNPFEEVNNINELNFCVCKPNCRK